MSIEYIAWASKQKVGCPVAKSILIAICNYADETGYAYPSQKRLSEFTEYSVRTIQRALPTLEKLGLLSRASRRRDDGYKTTDAFQVHMILGDRVSRDSVSCDRQSGDSVSNSQATECRDNVITNVITEPSGLTVRRKRASRSPKTVFSPPDWIPKTDWEDFLDMRRSIRKPMTDQAKTILVRKLEEMHRDGLDVGEVLQQSILNSWQSVYPPKGNHHANHHSPTDPSKLRGIAAYEFLERAADANLAATGLSGKVAKLTQDPF